MRPMRKTFPHDISQFGWSDPIATARLLGYSLECLPKSDAGQPPLREYVRHKVREDESRSIRGALEKAQYNRSLAARRLGISRTTLWRKLKEMGEGAE
jgi:transcriptional regulator with PAS, ATPase and Fis domain